VFTIRFGMRSRTGDPSTRADLYAAALDMSAWAEPRGCLTAIFSQHHGVDDGYLPSPVPLAAAVAARTRSLPIVVAALLLAFYEPVKLAEDLAVVDLISRGRVSYVVGIGYRDEEFALFGVERRGRGARVERQIGILKQLWSGRPVDIDGRTVRITPLPFTPGGPALAYGGGSLAAARRAGRLGLLFLAESSDPALEAAYHQAAESAGVPAAGCILPAPDVPLTVFVADDPDRAWAEIGEYLLVDATGYASWNANRPTTASVSFANSVEALAAELGSSRIMTPDAAADAVRGGIPLALQPLVGGIPPDVAWPYLEAAAAAAAAAGTGQSLSERPLS
jgi:alkanesulfonate monooxygenase SsuD/methylene tetrahydromethanopterin reductase-like flavin-dependent oxidoreductase (luciferase family)